MRSYTEFLCEFGVTGLLRGSSVLCEACILHLFTFAMLVIIYSKIHKTHSDIQMQTQTHTCQERQQSTLLIVLILTFYLGEVQIYKHFLKDKTETLV